MNRNKLQPGWEDIDELMVTSEAEKALLLAMAHAVERIMAYGPAHLAETTWNDLSRAIREVEKERGIEP